MHVLIIQIMINLLKLKVRNIIKQLIEQYVTFFVNSSSL